MLVGNKYCDRWGKVSVVFLLLYIVVQFMLL